MCPPIPEHRPSGRPRNSRRSRTGSTPRINMGGVPRWSKAIASPSWSWATTPATMPSSPTPRCISPDIRPSCHSFATASSNSRLRSICRYRTHKSCSIVSSSLNHKPCKHHFRRYPPPGVTHHPRSRLLVLRRKRKRRTARCAGPGEPAQCSTQPLARPLGTRGAGRCRLCLDRRC